MKLSELSEATFQEERAEAGWVSVKKQRQPCNIIQLIIQLLHTHHSTAISSRRQDQIIGLLALGHPLGTSHPLLPELSVHLLYAQSGL